MPRRGRSTQRRITARRPGGTSPPSPVPESTVVEVATSADLGTLLRERRQAAKLSQADVADLLGVDRRYVWSIEHGHDGLFAERVFALLALFDVRLRVAEHPLAAEGDAAARG